MATKEVMVTAPIVVALWDRTFAPARRVRWRLLAGLAATWLVLAVLVWNEHRAPSIAVGEAVTARYLFTQAPILLHYLRLSIVPTPLVLLYTWPIVPSLGAAIVPVIVVTCLVALTVVGVVRRSPLGFAGAWFFLILAPTSSVLPIITEVAAEHRMYLPLAAVVSVAVTGAFLAGRKLFDTQGGRRHTTAQVAAVVALAVVAVLFGEWTRARNETYWSETGIWADAVSKQPENQRARVLYGVALVNERRFADAETQLRAAVRLEPDDAVALSRLGGVLAVSGRLDEAIAAWTKSVALRPTDYDAQRHLGEAYMQRQQEREALEHLGRALEIDNHDPALLLDIATLLVDARDTTLRNAGRALELAAQAVTMTGRQEPRALDVLSAALAGAGRFREAADAAEEALPLARQQGNQRLVAELEYRASAYRARAGS